MQKSKQAGDGFERPAVLGQSDGILLSGCQNRMHCWEAETPKFPYLSALQITLICI